MEFSIKAPNALLWKTGYTETQVVEFYERGKMKEDWLICPLGEAGKAIPMAQFLKDRAILRVSTDSPRETPVSSGQTSRDNMTQTSVTNIGRKNGMVRILWLFGCLFFDHLDR
jgi:hypothetical protein